MNLLKKIPILLLLLNSQINADDSIPQAHKSIEGYVYKINHLQYLSTHPFSSFPHFLIEWRDQKDSKRVYDYDYDINDLFSKSLVRVFYKSIEVSGPNYLLKDAILAPNTEDCLIRNEILNEIL